MCTVDFTSLCLLYQTCDKMGFLGRNATSWDFGDGMRQVGNSWENLGRNATNNML